MSGFLLQEFPLSFSSLQWIEEIIGRYVQDRNKLCMGQEWWRGSGISYSVTMTLQPLHKPAGHLNPLYLLDCHQLDTVILETLKTSLHFSDLPFQS